MEGKEEWNTSAWVIDEKAHAQALGKKLVLLKETGVGNIGGLQGDYEYIEFDRNQLHKAAIRVIQTIWSLNPGKMSMSRSGPPGLSIDILEAAIAAQPEEPMLRVSLAQQHAVSGRLDAAARELRAALVSYPDFAPARLELAKVLTSFGRPDDAVKELDLVLRTAPLSASAHHQKGHVLEMKGDVEGAKKSFQTALNCDPGSANHYRCLGQVLFRAAGDNRSLLEQAKEMLELAIKFGGQHEHRICRGHLEAIRRKLKRKVGTPKVKETKNRTRRGKKIPRRRGADEKG